jgi:hypothetical protein
MVRSETRETSGTKRVRGKSALFSNRKRESIDGMNNAMAVRRMQRRKMSRIRSHMKESDKIKISRIST